jgi:hypothetical protein
LAWLIAPYAMADKKKDAFTPVALVEKIFSL